MIQKERVRPLNNEKEKRRDFVLYWMQASQRAEYNHALEHAAEQANARGKPLVVFFGLTEKFPEANERHYAFMLEGLKEVGRSLDERGIRFVVRHVSPELGAVEMARRADLTVADRGYLRVEREWRDKAARKIDCPLVQVETNVIVPLEQASPKEEWTARTIRPKIKRQLEKYLVPIKTDAVSHMSPYLHFGQVSPLYVALEVIKSKNKAADVYLEELIVRRELSMNFVYYNGQYDRFEGLPFWAQKTLKEHQKDAREAVYSAAELERARTSDPYWNAAQKEMILTGKMHNYMRMYWGKRIIEWTRTPEEAFRTAIYLNNKYELDGRDPNGFTGVAWCFGKHDRAWPSHSVLGKVRIMKASGLRRKFNADAYARKYEV